MANNIQIIIDAIDNASGPIGGINTVLSRTANFSMLAAGALGGALAGALVYSSNKAAEFEQVMSGVKAVSGASGEEMKSLSDLALQLGKDTSFSAMEAGQGIEELVKGGLTVPDIMNGAAKATLNLAAAGGVSLPDAATIAANALAQFSLKGEDMAHVADLIAGAANASAIDVSQFKMSLQAAGAVASTVGFSFDDLAQGIAIMGKAGIAGSDAGTSLKTMMMSLTPQTKAAAGLMQQLGIVTKDGANQFFDANGKVKSMADVANVLQNSLKGMTEQQRLSTLQALFGSDAVRAGAVLAKEGAQGFNDMAAAMGKVSAESVAGTKLDNVKGSLTALGGSIETLGIKIGLVLLPGIRWLTERAIEAVNGLMPMADQFAIMVEQIPAVVAQFKPLGEMLAKTFAPDKKATMIAIGVVLSTVVAIGALAAAAAFWSMMAPLLPLIAVLTTLGAAAYLLSVGWDNNFLGMRDAGEMLWKDFQVGFGIMTQVLGDWWQAAQPTIQAFIGELSRFWTEISPKLMEVWKNWTTGIGNQIKLITEVVYNGLSAIKGAWDSNAGGIRDIVSNSWNLIGGLFQAGWAIISEIVTVGLSILTGDWKGAFKGISDGADKFHDGLDKASTAFWKLFKQGVDLGISGVKWLWDGFVSYVGGVLSNLWDSITGSATNNFSAVNSEWKKITDTLTGLFNGAKDAIGNAVSTAIGWVKDRANDAKGGIEGAWNAIKEAVQGPLIAAKDSVANAVQAALDWVVSKANNGVGAIQGAWNSIKEAVQGPLIAAQTAITTAIDGALSAIGTKANAAKGGLDTAWNTVKEAVQGPLINAGTAIQTAIDTALNKIKDAPGNVKAAISSAWSSVASAVSGPLDALNDATNAGWQAIQNVISALNTILTLIGKVNSTPVNPPTGGGGGGSSGATMVGAEYMGGGATVNVYVSGSVISERDLAMVVREQLLTLKFANGTTGL